MSNILLSVIVPVYNVESYIERCATSLFNQTLKNGIEFIFVDDGAKDESISRLKKVIANFPDRAGQITIITHDHNKGLPSARKTGISAASGTYLAHCDSDDWVAPDIYEKLLNEIIETNTDMVWCDYFRSDGSAHKLIEQNCGNTQDEVLTEYLNPLTQTQPLMWNRIYKRCLHDEKFIYPTANYGEDLLAVTQLVLRSKSFSHITEPLYYYFNNNSSLCRNINEENIIKSVSGLIENTKLIESVLTSYGREKKYRDLITLCKYNCRSRLSIIIPNNREYVKLYKSIFPEIDKEIRHNKLLSIKSKARNYLLSNGFLNIYKLLLKLK